MAEKKTAYHGASARFFSTNTTDTVQKWTALYSSSRFRFFEPQPAGGPNQLGLVAKNVK
jgi:hypothetical protein